MPEKIEVVYKKTELTGFLDTYHKYILYTDKNGQEFYASATKEPLGSYPPPFGNITSSWGPFGPTNDNWDPSRDNPSIAPQPREKIIEGEDLSSKWRKITDTMDDIASRNIPYSPFSRNSNASADEAIRRAGLPAPALGDPTHYWAPGSHYDLPGGDSSPNGEVFPEGRRWWQEIPDWFPEWRKRRLDEPADPDPGGDPATGMPWPGTPWPGVSPKVRTTFDRVSRYPQRTDPFTLDLDGDGLETVGVNAANPLLFDINATGIKQSVGWVKPDDGLLALDRNGDGIINSGAELFGNFTPLAIGRSAIDGFEAIAEQDTNQDGIVNEIDAGFADLRIWQDINQDGISQSTELFSLAQKGITGIHVSKTEHFAVLDNGNALADLGTFTRTDGSEGTAGSVGQLGDIDLAVDTFYSQFADTIPSTTEAINLPDMGGSGQVRSLRQAASMDTVAGHALAQLLTQYSLATTQSEQRAQIDGLIQAWADTSSMVTTFTGAYAGHSLTVDMQAWWLGAGFSVGGADYLATANKLTVLERFNGRTYQPVPVGTDAVELTLWHDQQDLLKISYQ